MGEVIRKKSEGMTSYDTHDLGLAIAFLTKGHELINLQPVPDCECNGYVFHFKTAPELKKLEEAYWKGHLFVDAKHHNDVSLELSERFAEVEEEYSNDTDN